MNKHLLAALLGVPSAMAWTTVDDPRCHAEPNNPVIPPSPVPTPYPPAPTPIVVYDPPTSTTPAPTMSCPGFVTGFQIFDLESGEGVMDLEDGATVLLSDMPDKFTVKAVTTDGVDAVQMFFDDTLIRVGDASPFLYSSSEFMELYTQGTYSLSAFGSTESENKACGIEITIDYNNPHVCEGIVQQFSLFDTDTQAVVPGYEVLTNDQILQMSELPENLSIIAVTNGRGSGVVDFGLDGDNSFSYHTAHQSPHAVTGTDDNGNILPWSVISYGAFTISAKAQDIMGAPEDVALKCEITLHVEPDWSCPNLVSGFSVINTLTGKPVPGYENVIGARTISLKDFPTNLLAIEAHGNGAQNRIRFLIDGEYKREEGIAPYASNGDDMKGKFYADEFLQKTGTYEISAMGRNKQTNKWEPYDDRCVLSLTLDDNNSYETIDNDEYCAPEQVMPEQVGNHAFHLPPVELVSYKTNESVSFKTKNTIWSGKAMDWVTTSFVTKSGVEACDKISNMAYEQESEHVYEVKCFDGFAYADVYAYSEEFSDAQASADTSFLPLPCKNDFLGKVVKYTFVFSCDCENVPDVPDEVVGGPTKKSFSCTGTTAESWGDPHMVSFDDNKWNCQGEGEFVLAQADLGGYEYDFELHARFTRFGEDLPWSFNSALVAKQDVSVQISMGETQLPKSHMFDDVPINFYVDGQQRLFSEGSGDHRVIVTVDGFTVSIFFTTTGVMVRVKVRPFASDNHSGILDGRNVEVPGSFSIYLCLPNDNPDITDVIGLLGTPSGSQMDDFMDAMGNQLPVPSTNTERTAYCTEHWCVREPAQSLFTYEPGYDFGYYNLCDEPVRRHLVTDDNEEGELNVATFVDDCTTMRSNATLCEEIAKICAAVDDEDDDDSSVIDCFEDGLAAGIPGALSAVENIVTIRAISNQEKVAVQPDDSACCSDDFKTCVDDCVPSGYNDKCSLCSSDGTAIFLPHGSYHFLDPRGDFYGCLAEGETCDNGACCPGLACDDADNVCAAVVAPISGRRRLKKVEEVDFVRPDIPDTRNVVPFHSEL